MCGRFALRTARANIRRQPDYDLDVDEWEDEDDFEPRYNIAPRSNAPVLRRRDPRPSGSSGRDDAGASGSGSGAGPSDSATTAPGDASSSPAHFEEPSIATTSEVPSLKLQTMKWGLVPHWSKVEDRTLNTTNARSENLVEGDGLWGPIKGKKRCAVPCIGYYEWLTKGKEKLPHLTKRKDGALLFMAGLYDCAIIEGKPLWTFTIVTTEANKTFSWLHERQPVFLTTREEIDAWLDTSAGVWTDELTKMVRPYEGKAELECYQVPKEVGRVGTESSTFVEPVAKRRDGIEAMFAKQKQIQASPGKRRRSPSGTPEKVKDEDGHEDKKVKVELEESASPSKRSVKAEPHSPVKKILKSPPASPSKRNTKPSLAAAAVGSAKITSFFTTKG